jgi:hypothetical protein
LAFFAAAGMFTKRWKTNAALQREQAVLARQADSSSRGLYLGLFTAFCGRATPGRRISS